MGQEEYTTRSTESHNFTHITGYSCLLDDTRPIEEVSLSAVKDCVLQDFSSYKEVLQLDKKYEVFGEKRLIEFSSTRCHVALQVTLSACVPSMDGSYRTSSSFISYDGDLGISKTQCQKVFRDGVLTLSFGREQLTLQGLEKNSITTHTILMGRTEMKMTLHAAQLALVQRAGSAGCTRPLRTPATSWPGPSLAGVGLWSRPSSKKSSTKNYQFWMFILEPSPSLD